jgi:non-ribosomal peptide synthetase-like protein
MTISLTDSGPGTIRPAATVEQALGEVLADVLGAGQVPADGHFFDDLGADSMVMARFCARVRKREDLPAPSMKQVYAHPTISGLAAALTASAPAPQRPRPDGPEPAPAAPPVGTLGYVACGAVQVLAVAAYLYLAALTLGAGYSWVSAGSGPLELYLRSVVVGGAVFLGACALPVVAKWVLVGRWTPREIRIWSPAYARFWVVKTLLRTSPAMLFVGSPLYVGYLRALGARIGRGAVILTQRLPVCTDLLTVGAGAVVRKDCFLNCYRAESGVIRTGPVRIGRDAVVGEETVLDIDTGVGDGARLGHSSSLLAGEYLPAHDPSTGHPTDPGGADLVATGAIGLRRAGYAAYQLVVVLAAVGPLAAGGLTLLVRAVPSWFGLAGPASPSGLTYVLGALAVSFVLFSGTLVVGLVVATTIPRLLNLAITPDRVYPLYGVHYALHRAIARLTNVAFFVHLFGDSSYVVHYLRWLGYDLSQVQQTGSNFGLEVKHETPFLVTVGRGTMVADGLSVINADFSSTAFRVSRARIGAHSFLGNYVAYPSQARTGDDCLLATKVKVPVAGDRVEGVGLLGSPGFEIPRTVARDSRFDELTRPAVLRRRLAAKNRHNAVTIGLFLLVRWLLLSAIVLLAWVAGSWYDVLGAAGFALAGVLSVAVGVVFPALAERASTGFRDLTPRFCSIYDPYFWWHERFWKLAGQPRVLDGTPFKGLAWRLLGVRIGRRVYDDGCAIVEKTMVTLGDDCALNAMSVIQPHSQEDGTFKSDRISIGNRCSIGTRAVVHYGTTISDGAVLAPDSFLMKGEDVPAGARWGMNPARPLGDETP